MQKCDLDSLLMSCFLKVQQKYITEQRQKANAEGKLHLNTSEEFYSKVTNSKSRGLKINSNPTSIICLIPLHSFVIKVSVIYHFLWYNHYCPISRATTAIRPVLDMKHYEIKLFSYKDVRPEFCPENQMATGGN